MSTNHHKQNARYKIVQEPSHYGLDSYAVYEKSIETVCAMFSIKQKTFWNYRKAFATLEEAEKYVDYWVKYREAEANPKVIGYY